MDPHSKEDTNHESEMLWKGIPTQSSLYIVNEEVRNTIRHAIGPYDRLTDVKKRKLRWYGHITRSTGLTEMIRQGTVQGEKGNGRQRKSWENNTMKWTGLKLGEALPKAENREGWRNWLPDHP